MATRSPFIRVSIHPLNGDANRCLIRHRPPSYLLEHEGLENGDQRQYYSARIFSEAAGK